MKGEMGRKQKSHIQAKKKIVEGVEFDSAFEAEYYLYLRALEMAGQITNLMTKVAFPLQNESVVIRELRGEKVRTYTPDFIFLERPQPGQGDGYKRVAVETKGYTTKENSLRFSVFKALYPDVELRVVKQKTFNKQKKKAKK